MQTNRERNLISWGIVFGSITGAAAAYFLAPKKGTEMKKTVAKNLNRFTQTSILRTQSALINFETAMEKRIERDKKAYKKI